MKIVIDARMWAESGIGRYIRNLVNELQELDHENEYFVLLLKKDFNSNLLSGSSGPKSGMTSNFHKVMADFRWYTVKEQIRLPWILKQINADLVHFPHFNMPIFFQGKFVVSIHDLIHQHFSMEKASTHGFLTHKFKKIGYNQVFKKAIRDSQKILTPSNFVKNQLEKEWGVNPGKIIVTPEGVDDKLSEIANNSSQTKSNQILEKFQIKKPFLFYVGNAHPHKNVESLIRAFSQLRQSNNGLHLVLSGADNYFWKRLRQEFKQSLRPNGLKDTEGIIYTGFVTEEELVVLYKNAECFVTTSLEEGFGIPILEAMAAGTPVVCSNAGSLLEIGGKAAIYFNPQDIGDIVEKVSKVLNDEKLRQDLIVRGRVRVREFSWKKMAQQTLEVYNSII